MKTFIEIQQAGLIKKFHTLLRAAGMDDEDKETILHNYGVKSSKELSISDLTIICDKLYAMSNPKLMELNKLRKRVMASVGGYLREMGYNEGSDVIKKIACRASQCKEFNDIPAEKLRALYNAFNHYKKAMINVRDITEVLLMQ